MSEGKLMKENDVIAASKWWVWAAIVVCVATFVWASRMALMAYLTNSAERWPSLTLALGAYFVIFLIVVGTFNLCSVRIDADSVRQTRVFSQGRFFVTNQLPWEEITSAEVKPGAYRLSSPSVTIEIYTMVFSDPERATAIVHRRLPDQLKRQAT